MQKVFTVQYTINMEKSVQSWAYVVVVYENLKLTMVAM